jgi:23S rRNA pseudouridine2605 synthase
LFFSGAAGSGLPVGSKAAPLKNKKNDRIHAHSTNRPPLWGLPQRKEQSKPCGLAQDVSNDKAFTPRSGLVVVPECADLGLPPAFVLPSPRVVSHSVGVHSHRHVSQARRAKQSVGLARALSKLGFCSRSQAWTLIEAGRVRVNGVVRREPECRVDWKQDRLEVEGRAVQSAAKVYLMLNKPRGLVTTASDEHGRATVFACLAGKELPFVAPIGRLDKASEGLLLFTNDTEWAARIAAPESRLDKTYHVQVNCVADEVLARRVQQGVQADGELLCARRVIVLRCGEKNSWLEVVLNEGKNRHIRRLLAALGINVLRLVRVAIGALQLGNLPKGQTRRLTREEARALALPETSQAGIE